MEQRLVRKRNVYERGDIFRPQRVAQNIANDPRMLACEVHKRKALFLARELGHVSSGLR